VVGRFLNEKREKEGRIITPNSTFLIPNFLRAFVPLCEILRGVRSEERDELGIRSEQ
jgi:hypothetical protein